MGETSPEPSLSNADRRMCAEVIEKCRHSDRTLKNARLGELKSIDDVIATCNVRT